MTFHTENLGTTGMAAALLKPLAQRLKGPGGLYNLGNAIGLAGGLAATFISIPDEQFGLSSLLAAAGDFAYGSPAALALTLATAVFFWSGEEYHRAWSRGFPPEAHRVRMGDLSSAVGAVLLALAFFALGNVVLALTAGVMHAAGKLGSAVADGNPGTGAGRRGLCGLPCREIVLLSRLPAVAMAITGLLAATPAGDGAAPHLLSGVLLVCSVVWAAADIMLLPATSALSPRRIFGSSASTPPM